MFQRFKYLLGISALTSLLFLSCGGEEGDGRDTVPTANTPSQKSSAANTDDTTDPTVDDTDETGGDTAEADFTLTCAKGELKALIDDTPADLVLINADSTTGTTADVTTITELSFSAGLTAAGPAVITATVTLTPGLSTTANSQAGGDAVFTGQLDGSSCSDKNVIKLLEYSEGADGLYSFQAMIYDATTAADCTGDASATKIELCVNR
jgi:hypothetical protein